MVVAREAQINPYGYSSSRLNPVYREVAYAAGGSSLPERRVRNPREVPPYIEIEYGIPNALFA